MTTKKLMMAAGAIAGPQVIAPSSNDWDYTFDGGGEWPAAGNALGDGTSGGYIDNIGGDSAISSLITLDGDYEIQFTIAGTTSSAFGVLPVDEDDARALGYSGAKSMTNSFSWIDAGTNPKDFFIGSTAQGDTNTFAVGSVVKITRVSGTITVYDDDVSVHVFGTTYSGAMRLYLAAGGSPFAMDVDDLLITDTDKVQRDGFFNEGSGASRASAGSSNDFSGQQWIATRTGTITAIKLKTAGGTGGNAHCEIWSSDGASPVGQIGSDSSTQTFASGVGTQTFTLAVPVVKGTKYWAVHSSPSGSYDLSRITHSIPSMICGRASTAAGIASIVDDGELDLAMEITIEATEEPTPDHDTLLLVHSDTSDASTTFVDSSPSGRTVTVGGDAQHDTAQKKFGASSMLFDGTGDYLTFPDSSDWNFGSGFTIDFWIKFNSLSQHKGIIGHHTSNSWSGINFLIHVKSTGVMELYFGNGGGTGKQVTVSGFTTATWYHIALVRNGTSIRVMKDGTMVVDTTGNMSGNDISAPVRIGTSASASYYDLDGWMDEIRISNVARWDASFTPPSAPYS